jgi:type II secretory pathway component PulJ
MRLDFRHPGFFEAAVLALAIGAVLLFITWEIASRPVSPTTQRLQQEVDFLAEELDAMHKRMGRLEARNAVLERESDVLRQANSLLREQESSRQALINQQQSELDFFRRLAGTGGTQSGLDVYHVELLPTGSARVFQFVLTLTQNIRRASIVSGDGETPEPSFSFKYFQQLEGYLTLPEGFDPIRLELSLEAEGPRAPVQRSYDWNELLQAAAGPH